MNADIYGIIAPLTIISITVFSLWLVVKVYCKPGNKKVSTIKIIRPAKIHTKECDKCGCKFSYTALDFTGWKWRYPATDTGYFLKCPCCNHDVAHTPEREYPPAPKRLPFPNAPTHKSMV